MVPKLSEATKRRKRYIIQAPLQYRMRGERMWHSGKTHNISETGILFEGEGPLTPGAQLEVHLAMAPVFGARRGTIITFHATILRSPREGVWAARMFAPRLRGVHAGCTALTRLSIVNSA